MQSSSSKPNFKEFTRQLCKASQDFVNEGKDAQEKEKRRKAIGPAGFYLACYNYYISLATGVGLAALLFPYKYPRDSRRLVHPLVTAGASIYALGVANIQRKFEKYAHQLYKSSEDDLLKQISTRSGLEENDKTLLNWLEKIKKIKNTYLRKIFSHYFQKLENDGSVFLI